MKYIKLFDKPVFTNYTMEEIDRGKTEEAILWSRGFDLINLDDLSTQAVEALSKHIIDSTNTVFEKDNVAYILKYVTLDVRYSSPIDLTLMAVGRIIEDAYNDTNNIDPGSVWDVIYGMPT